MVENVHSVVNLETQAWILSRAADSLPLNHLYLFDPFALSLSKG